MISAVIVVCSTKTRKLAKSCSFEIQNLDGVDLHVLISHISGFLQVVLGLLMSHRKKIAFLQFIVVFKFGANSLVNLGPDGVINSGLRISYTPISWS